MDNIKIFKNPQFGEIRTMTQDGEPWFDGKPDVRRETLWTMAGHRFIRDLMTKTEA